jgi:hypothetical protein
MRDCWNQRCVLPLDRTTGVTNCWARNLTIKNADMYLYFNLSSFCTATNITLGLTKSRWEREIFFCCQSLPEYKREFMPCIRSARVAAGLARVPRPDMALWGFGWVWHHTRTGTASTLLPDTAP